MGGGRERGNGGGGKGGRRERGNGGGGRKGREEGGSEGEERVMDVSERRCCGICE